MPLVRGGGGPAHDRQGEHVVYVCDSLRFPFFRAGAHHQFHRNAVLRRSLPPWYTGALEQQQAGGGRLAGTGCAGAGAATTVLLDMTKRLSDAGSPASISPASSPYKSDEHSTPNRYFDLSAT